MYGLIQALYVIMWMEWERGKSADVTERGD
jgi:hypothetical protein